METDDRQENSAQVIDLAWRPTESAEMQRSDACEVQPGQGVVNEGRGPGDRQVTILASESWADACRELDAELPWTLRRANILTSGIDLAPTIGRILRIGAVRVEVVAETKPCGLMDRQHMGLRKALVPACRGGVYGRVLDRGIIRPGDAVQVFDSVKAGR